MKKVLAFCFRTIGSDYTVDLMFIKTTENEILPIGTRYCTSSQVFPRFDGKVSSHAYSEDTDTFETMIFPEIEIEKEDVSTLKEIMTKGGWSISIDSSKE